MTYEQVERIICLEARKSDYNLKERKAATTDSKYYTLYSEGVSLLFRVSDHPTYSRVTTLRIDHRITPKQVQNFIKNRIKDLQYRKVKRVIGL